MLLAPSVRGGFNRQPSGLVTAMRGDIQTISRREGPSMAQTIPNDRESSIQTHEIWEGIQKSWKCSRGTEGYWIAKGLGQGSG
jgi:hypothetical protein